MLIFDERVKIGPPLVYFVSRIGHIFQAKDRSIASQYSQDIRSTANKLNARIARQFDVYVINPEVQCIGLSIQEHQMAIQQ